MNKIFIFFLIAGSMAGCCTSRYCDPQRPINTFNDIVIRQISEGSRKSAANFRGMGNYLIKDVQTAGRRVAKTGERVYDGVSFFRGVKNMGKTISVFMRQVKESGRDMAKDFRVIGRAACIGGD